MYIGRFAPSPTGALHAGSLVAALASWLDARAHGGRWLVRIEDVDAPRCVPGVDALILQQLEACGLVPDAPPVWQSQRTALYQQALDRLIAVGHAYPCACSRKDIEHALAASGHGVHGRGDTLPYPGTCRPERGGPTGRTARAWRLHIGKVVGDCMAPGSSLIHWTDRRLGAQQQDVAAEVGDFVLKRADGLWAYQLAVVVDDGAQGITDVVRGADLADNTARQIVLQQALALPTPRYLHLPLVLGTNGEKLSKQNGAGPLNLSNPVAAMRQAAFHLGLDPLPSINDLPALLARWVAQWASAECR